MERLAGEISKRMRKDSWSAKKAKPAQLVSKRYAKRKIVSLLSS